MPIDGSEVVSIRSVRNVWPTDFPNCPVESSTQDIANLFGSGGDASATSVTVPGGVSRLLSSRAADIGFNVLDFGVKGDAVSISGFVTTSGTSLKVNSATFTAADVGKPIVVEGAGASGGGFFTYIAAVVDTIHVTTIDPAPTSLTASQRTVWYGTDDGPAINAALAIVRAYPTLSTSGRVKRVVFPPGRIYFTTVSLNFTLMYGTFFEGTGAYIYASTNGYAAFDMLGNYGCWINGFVQRGCMARPPSIGWWAGRYEPSGTAYGRNVFSNLTSNGYFSTTPFYDMGSETSGFTRLNMNNLAANAYGMIIDGVRHFPSLVSAYVTITLSTDTQFTNTVKHYQDCQFSCTGTSPTGAWVCNVAGLTFDRCYTYSPAGPALVLFQKNSRSTAIIANFSMEGPVSDFVVIDGDASIGIEGLELRVGGPTPTNSFLRIGSAVTTVNIYDAEFHLGSQVPKWFDGPNVLNLTGNLSGDPTGFVIPANFQGYFDSGAPPSGGRSYYGFSQTSIVIGAGAAVSNTGLVAIGPRASASAPSGGSVAIGTDSSASGASSIAIGNAAVASASSGVAFGSGSNSNTLGKIALSSGKFTFAGDNQVSINTMLATSSSATVVRLTTNGGAAGPTNIINSTLNSSYIVTELSVIARDTVTGDVAAWSLAGPFVVRCGATGATLAILGSVTFTSIVNTGGGSIAAMSAPSVGVDTTNIGLNLSATPTGTNICHIGARLFTQEIR